MGKTLTDWFRWFTRRAPTSEARMDVANSNLASIRLMGSFVIALETITLAYVLLVPEGQIQSRTASAMSVGLILLLCIVSIWIAHVLKRGEKTSVLAADALLVAIFVLATAWGIFASYRHYVVGEQIVTFYVVQLCFICFLLTKPLQSVIMYGGAFGTFYAMCVAFDGAPSLNVTNYVLFAVIAILGATVRYQTMIDVFARRRQIDELNEELRHTSTHDELTGLLNRMALRDRFESYLGHDLHVLILDVDHFKEFNDAFGRRHHGRLRRGMRLPLRRRRVSRHPRRRVGRGREAQGRRVAQGALGHLARRREPQDRLQRGTDLRHARQGGRAARHNRACRRKTVQCQG